MPTIAATSTEANTTAARSLGSRSVVSPHTPRPLRTTEILKNDFSIALYGSPSTEIDDLIDSIQTHGILVPLVVSPLTQGEQAGGSVSTQPERWLLISGHRRLACAMALGLAEVPCEISTIPSETAMKTAVLEYNRQRRKTFSQSMREADALEELWKADARSRRLGNLRKGRNLGTPTVQPGTADCRNSDNRDDCTEPGYPGEEWGQEQERAVSPLQSGEQEPSNRKDRRRTDEAIARRIGLGGKDLYRQARAVWQAAGEGDARAISGVAQLDAGTKTIHAAYKDLRRRDRFSADFRPTPYDVWSFRHDRAFGIPHPGSIPAGIVAHTLHYFSPPGGLVVDPMAGGGTTVDVCQGMGRRYLAYDLQPTRPEIREHDITTGFPKEAAGCDLIFCDPPYHTMLAKRYPAGSVASAPLSGWMDFLDQLTRSAFATLRPGGYLALLLAPQTEKDIPAGVGYLDHTLFGYMAGVRAGFLPERRISCPMDGAYLPQHVRRARQEGRMLGQVRDLLVLRKPLPDQIVPPALIPFTQDIISAP